MREWLQALALCMGAVVVFIGGPIAASMIGTLVGIGVAIMIVKYIFEEYNDESAAERGNGSDEKSTH